MARPREKLEDKFWRRVEKKEFCWEWIGSKFRGGYGQLTHGEEIYQHKNLKAHRVSYEIHFGKIPEDKIVCHHCDNASCVNPDHLFLGTWQDNVQDMIQKGRRFNTEGEKNGQSKLTDNQVKEIREKYKMNEITGRYLRKKYSNAKLAKEYGITQSVISDIITYKKWKHIE